MNKRYHGPIPSAHEKFDLPTQYIYRMSQLICLLSTFLLDFCRPYFNESSMLVGLILRFAVELDICIDSKNDSIETCSMQIIHFCKQPSSERQPCRILIKFVSPSP